jgi:hypothetical protein
MELTDIQKEKVKQWVEKGLSLSDIQKEIASEFGIKLTFMDVRFLVIDLEVEIKDGKSKRPVEKVEPPVTPPPAAVPSYKEQPAGPYASAATPPPPPAMANVSVTLDTIITPGYLVSGTVTFSDGISATWGLDQTGRLALDAGQPGYKPTQEDVQVFQEELRKLVEQKGL